MKTAESNEDRPGDVGRPSNDEMDVSRREMLAKIGPFAYAAPALVLLGSPKACRPMVAERARGTGMVDKNHDKSGPLGLIRKRTGLIKKKKMSRSCRVGENRRQARLTPLNLRQSAASANWHSNFTPGG
jgi:hypothetical protein